MHGRQCFMHPEGIMHHGRCRAARRIGKRRIYRAGSIGRFGRIRNTFFCVEPRGSSQVASWWASRLATTISISISTFHLDITFSSAAATSKPAATSVAATAAFAAAVSSSSSSAAASGTSYLDALERPQLLWTLQRSSKFGRGWQ